MKRFIALAVALAVPSFAAAEAITTKLVQLKANATTNALVYAGEFDVYSIVASNPNAAAATSLELSLGGTDMLGLADRTFKVGANNPLVFGFEAPDSFFVLPAGVDPADVLAVNTVDTATSLATSYTVAGGAELIPAGGVDVPIVTISVPAGTAWELPEVLGRAAVSGAFESVVGATVDIPEPTTVMLAGLALVGFAARRK